MTRPMVMVFALVVLTQPLAAAEPVKTANGDEKISYYRTIRPIFVVNCQGCHQPALSKGGYVMTSHADLLNKADSDKPCVIPGKPEQSLLVELIIPQKGMPPEMPKGKPPLSANDVAVIKKWIAQGALDDSPKSAKTIIDMAHPPAYKLPPVITTLDFSPDGSQLAVGGYHEVLIHKADGSGLISRLVGLSERIQAIAYSPDGKLLAVAGGAPGRFGEIQVWEVAKKKLKLSLSVTNDTVYGLRWSHDASKISFGCADNTLRAIDAETGKQVLFQGAHNDWVLGTIFSTDSSHLISVSRDMSMKLTHVQTQRFVDNITSITPGALKGGLMSVDRHPKKDEVVIGGSDGEPKIYRIYRDPKKPRQIGDDFNRIIGFAAMPGRVFAVRYSPDGNRIAAGSSKDGAGEVRIHESANGKLVAKLEGQKGPVYALAYHKDGKVVASAGFDGVVRLNDANTGKLIREYVPVPVQAKLVKLGSK